MVKILLESKFIGINLVLLAFFAVRLYAHSKTLKHYKLLEYFSLSLFFSVPLMKLDSVIAANISITSLGCFIASLARPHLLSQLSEDTLRQKKNAILKLPFLFVVIFFTLSNHVELIYVYVFSALVIIYLKKSLASAFFSWPLLLSGFFVNSVIMEALVTISFCIGIYLFEDKNV